MTGVCTRCDISTLTTDRMLADQRPVIPVGSDSPALCYPTNTAADRKQHKTIPESVAIKSGFRCYSTYHRGIREDIAFNIGVTTHMTLNTAVPNQYVKDLYLADLLSVSRGTVWRWSRNGQLPKPIQLGPATKRWRLDEVLSYIDEDTAEETPP